MNPNVNYKFNSVCWSTCSNETLSIYAIVYTTEFGPDPCVLKKALEKQNSTKLCAILIRSHNPKILCYEKVQIKISNWNNHFLHVFSLGTLWSLYLKEISQLIFIYGGCVCKKKGVKYREYVCKYKTHCTWLWSVTCMYSITWCLWAAHCYV